MTYKIIFLPSALKEWKKLSHDTREQFQKKLRERSEFPHIPSAALSGMQDCYKIKLRTIGYRLVYRVYNKKLIVEVVAVGARDKSSVYNKAKARLN